MNPNASAAIHPAIISEAKANKQKTVTITFFLCFNDDG